MGVGEIQIGTESPAPRHVVGLRLLPYRPVWPVYIVGDDRSSLSFTVELGDRTGVGIREDEKGHLQPVALYALEDSNL